MRGIKVRGGMNEFINSFKYTDDLIRTAKEQTKQLFKLYDFKRDSIKIIGKHN